MPESEKPAISGLKAAGIGCAVVVLVPVVFLLGLIITYSVQRATPEDYPEVKPEAMGRRLGGYSQDAYAALGIDRVLDPAGEGMREGDENHLSNDYCYPDGLESLADEPEEGAYQMGHSWALQEVDKDQGLAALRRLHSHLGASAAWRVTQSGYDDEYREWRVSAERDGGYQVSVAWSVRDQRLGGGVSAPCAYDPDWPEEGQLSDLPDTGTWPPPLTPRAMSRGRSTT
ncbi:hypothetical protein [Streptomyces lonegramiae]|uniref:Uncharacterized protein n=1 Tax=Streptomyces lonegramiae TaxID=3075524 RepID=A0ABU2XPA3_9ACTN|nr:hypothetical protein [Streptomyces sp. DSM 41529]MDT0547763.1 hypothetical protein [Streptomyces sp. DSM 41529]